MAALDKALITEGHFARLLGVDRLEARRAAEVLRERSSNIIDHGTAERDLSQLTGA